MIDKNSSQSGRGPKDNGGSSGPLGLLVVLCLCAGCEGSDQTTGEEDFPLLTMTGERWAASADLNISIQQQGKPHIYLTEANRDFKPSWSKSGSMIAFFRLLNYGPEFAQWKTKLCVINANGSGLRELTDGAAADFNHTWTRDGTNMILFNRYAVDHPGSNDIYLTSPTATPGEEVLLSHPDHDFEWAMSGLSDGRIFIDRIVFPFAAPPKVRSFLMTPNPGGIGHYEELIRPTTKMWHKLSVSPDETKVAYMLDNNDDMSSYADVVLYYADFDKERLVVENPVAITEKSPESVEEYPRWSADGSLIIYDSNRTGIYQLYAYRPADGEHGRLSADQDNDYQFGNFENAPK